MNITVIGIGRLGLGFALMLEKNNYNVLGIDINEEYVASLNSKTFKCNEPQYNELLQQSTNFIASTKLIDGINHSDIIFIIVQTPNSGGERFYDHSILSNLLIKIDSLKPTNKDIIIGCTVIPKYINEIGNGLISNCINCHLSYNPEFVAQGDIINGFKKPDIILLGTNNESLKPKIKSIYEKMCEIVKIPENIPQENELNSGGAQYMMKNIDHTYWEKVEHDSDALYQYFLDHLVEHPETPEYHAIQKWTADMWAVLWNAWYFGHEVRTPPELEFSWGTCGVDNWQKNTIYHNAGVLDAEKEKYFYKGQYNNKIPYNITNHVDPGLASHNYVKEILETAKKTCL